MAQDYEGGPGPGDDFVERGPEDTAAGTESGGPPPKRPSGLLGNPLYMMFLVIIVFWALILWPQRKKQKKHQRMVSTLQAGDRVVTSGGIHGVVRGRNDDQNKVTVEIAKGIRVEVAKGNITAVLEKDSG